MIPAVEARGLARTFRTGWRPGGRRPGIRAVRGVDLLVEGGTTLGIVGESGCGKSTLARMLVGLETPDAGTIRLEGRDVTALAGRRPRALAGTIQYVFQDPVAALNPRRTVAATLAAPLARLLGLGRGARAARLTALLEDVGLSPALLGRYPHELSGGQAQRVGIARALAAEARILVLDEPVSSLDVSVQAQVLDLLARLKAARGLTYVFIAHDLAVVEQIADAVAVMYLGRVVEAGPARAVFANPRHPYTALLMAAARDPGGSAGNASPAELPDPSAPPPGCAFAPRCPAATALCRERDPPLEPRGEAAVACWHPAGE